MKSPAWKTDGSRRWGGAVLLLAMLSACGGGDDAGGSSGAANQKPTADAGADQSADAKTDVALAGSGSDSDGSITSYSWTQTAGPTVALTGGGSQAPSFTAPDVDTVTALSFQLTVTDDGGATASDTMDVEIAPIVTLSGKAYDGPIPNATITVTVGGKTYTATADATGTYVINVGAIDPAAFITITATGGAGQEFVELLSIAGTFGAMRDAAGADGVLEPTESGATNVTNLSTAKAVLILEANGGVQPTGDAELTDLEKTIDGTALLELATVIKLVIDEGVSLPAGTTSTLDLLQDNNAIDAVIADAEAANPGIFDVTLDAILSDPNLTAPITAEDVPELYLVNLVDCYVCANRGFVVESLQGGVGHIYGAGSAVSADTTWSIGSEGQVVITIDAGDPLITQGLCNSTSGQVDCVVTVTSLEFRLLTDGAMVDTVAMRQIGTIAYPVNPELSTEALDSTSIRLGMEPGALEIFTAADITGTWSVPLALPNPDPVGDEYEAGLLTFNADNTGTRPADGVTFTWSIGADGALNIAFNTGDKLDIYWLRDESELSLDAMMVVTTAGDDTYTLPQLVVRGVDAAYAGTLVLADFDGEWTYADWSGLTHIISSATSAVIATYYDIAGNITEQFPNEAQYDSIKFDNISWWDIDNNQSVPNCTGVTTCFNDYTSSWYPLAKDSSGRIYFLEEDRSWDYDAAASSNDYRGALNYTHRINRWFDFVAPLAGGGSAKRSISTGSAVDRGARVRVALGNPLADISRRR